MKCICLIVFVILQIVTSNQLLAQDRIDGQCCPQIENITAKAETDKFYWIGTTHGLYYVRKKCGRVFHMTSHNSVFLSDTITAIAVRSNGEVYIGTPKGIVRYDNYAFLLITAENSSLQSNNITSLICVYGTEILAGTFDGGMTVFSSTRSKTFTVKNSPFTSNHIVSLEKTGEDSIVALLDNNTHVIIRKDNFK